MTIYRNRADRNKLITRSSDARCRRYARRRALRRIIHTLMNVYRDEDGWVALLERQPIPKGTTTPTHANERPTCMTAWVDDVHGPDAHKGDLIKRRITHAILTLATYVRLVVRPRHAQRDDAAVRMKRRQHARWEVCAYLVRTYKNQKQQNTLDERADARRGLVCAHTRNVGRLTPKGDVTYDETKRYAARIRVDETYKTHRWPRRDKCGPTLARILQHVWGIT